MIDSKKEVLKHHLTSLLESLDTLGLRPPGTVEEWIDFGEKCSRVKSKHISRLMNLLFHREEPTEEEGYN